MKYELTREALAELATHSASSSVCLSLYQSTHRHNPANQQDPIRFRNLVKALEKSLLQQHPDAEVRKLLEPFHALRDDREFWNTTLDGLAVLAGADMFRIYRLRREVPELAIVANSFHTKPLRKFLQSTDRFQVLGLSRSRMQLFEGNRDALDEIEPAGDTPRTLTAALGSEVTDPYHAVASYGGAGSSHGPMHHGHGSKKDEVDQDAERFFRAVDRAVLAHHSTPSGLPLILAALPEHHNLFHSVSRNPFLLKTGVPANPEGLSSDELRERVWAVIEPHYRARLDALVDEFSAVHGRGLGDDDLAQVAQAAVSGRVAKLLIEAGRQEPGRVDADTGEVKAADLNHPEVDDLLDDLAELVEKHGGEVHALPAELMPGRNSGVAAIYRH